MTSLFDRRHSHRFAELMDAADGRRRHHRRTEFDSDLGPLVRTARELAAAATVIEPTAEFRRQLRARLMTTARCDAMGASPPVLTRTSARALGEKTRAVGQVSRGGSGRARAAVLVGVAAGAMALSGVSAASTASLPGDALYQVKRSSELAQLALASSDLSRGQLYLELAEGRAKEAVKAKVRFLPDVLSDMDAETQAGVRLLTTIAVHRHDVGPLNHTRDFVDRQRQTLAGVAPRSRLIESLRLLQRVEARALALEVALTNGCATTATDELGPKPTTC